MVKKLLLSSFALLAIHNCSNAQTAADYAVQLEAAVQTAPPKVTLSWKSIPGTTQYNIFKKTKSATAWASLGNTTDTFYVDVAVTTDTSFEYKVSNTGGTIAATGHIFAGINNPPIHQKGTLILVVDTLFRDSCATELKQLMKDLNADGWALKRIDVNRTTPDSIIKKSIKNYYTSFSNVNAVLLIGHVAVPYSGLLNPDAHPDHLGAWPADVYYADMDGSWTDVSVNNTSASRTQNKNIPGDGKWDQSTIPTAIELQVGRIDFYNMSSFVATEVSMMKNYLAKAHLYKMDSIYVSKNAIVDDNFGAFSGEAFAANAWRNFSTIIGRNKIKTGDLISTLNDSAYQWAYGCGGGSYTSCSGVGTTANFAANKQKGIFTILFGSYFGDWDSQNNLLRAPLCCTEPALASFWAGRPNWYFHHIALGENIGYGAYLTQNNGYGTYSPYGYMATGVHVALMGDLSLRNSYIKPAKSLIVSTASKKGATINWVNSPDAAVIGYYVYRSDSLYGIFEKISGLVAGTSFKDTIGKDGLKYYMVRPCKLETTASGTYFNLGLGISDTVTVSFPDPVGLSHKTHSAEQLIIFPNPATALLNIYINRSFEKASIIKANITDISGKTVQTFDYHCQQKETTFSVNIEDLQTGIYLIELWEANNKLGSLKFLKK